MVRGRGDRLKYWSFFVEVINGPFSDRFCTVTFPFESNKSDSGIEKFMVYATVVDSNFNIKPKALVKTT